MCVKTSNLQNIIQAYIVHIIHMDLYTRRKHLRKYEERKEACGNDRADVRFGGRCSVGARAGYQQVKPPGTLLLCCAYNVPLYSLCCHRCYFTSCRDGKKLKHTHTHTPASARALFLTVYHWMKIVLILPEIKKKHYICV